jgi:hypothetical protein
MRFKFMPGAQVDVHSFELKTETGCSVLRSTKPWRRQGSPISAILLASAGKLKSEARLAEIEDHCGEHGIGLIRMRDPQAKAGCEILVDPVRKSTLPMAIEGFLEARLSAAQKGNLAGVVRGR